MCFTELCLLVPGATGVQNRWSFGMAKKLLVIDQNIAVQRLLEFTLGKAGFEITAVEDALSGLDSAVQSTPDLIMVDTKLEGLPLSKFVKKVRDRPGLQATPIVLMAQADDTFNMTQDFLNP